MIERRRRFSGRDLLLDMQFPWVPADHSSICRCILKSPRIGPMSFGMISYVRENQHESKDCFIPARVPKASGGCGQIVTQRHRPARLKNFHLPDGRSHATLVNIEEGFCGLQDHHRYRATSFAKASCNDRRGYCRLPPKDFGSLALISVLFVEHQREIVPEKPPRAVMRVADLFAKRGSNQKEMSSPGAGSVGAKKTAGFKEPCGFY
jgi:hypothetical protein